MLRKSDVAVSDILPRFTARSLEVSFLVPTSTGLQKAILDAVGPLRQFLRNKGFHDFDAQAQADKVIRRAYFVHETGLEETKVSLYRPLTKQGDPRIWFYGLPRYARAFNLLAILCEGADLYVVNASNARLLESLQHDGSPLHALAARHDQLDAATEELLLKLKEVGRRGYVQSLRRGDTGVGFTLEAMLGIAANVRRTPDFRGIEIKASRRFGGAAKENRVTLFSQVPSWRQSPLPNGRAILDTYGYNRAGRRQLYCTVGATANSQGLYFDASDPNLLWSRARIGEQQRDVVCWATPDLLLRLQEKHPATMWIKARCRGDRNSCEEFHYVEAIYTRNPLSSSLMPLLDDGTVTMDFTLSERDGGGVRDHGYLFKIRPADLPSLFPPPRKFVLTD